MCRFHKVNRGVCLGILIAINVAFCSSGHAVDPDGAVLPFDREAINRYSLDHLPRSLSIRQNQAVWLGYDLQRGKLYKAWQAPSGEPGLKPADPRSGLFLVRSRGTAWYEDSSDATWRLRRAGEPVTLAVRYQGCSQRDAGFELIWELKHDRGAIRLIEHVPSEIELSKQHRIVREIRVESLGKNETLLLPLDSDQAWTLTTATDTVTTSISDASWHRLTLP